MYFPIRCDNTITGTKTISDPINIYISFGTIYNSDVDLFEQLIEKLANTSHNIIVSVGGNNATLNTLAPYRKLANIDVRYFVDQNFILEDTDIFITHGGLNSASESVCSLVPMVVIPLVGDQHSIAKSLEVKNSGIVVNRDEIKENILPSINHIFDNWEQYQENLSIIRESFTDFSTADNTVGKINSIIDEDYSKMEL